MSVPQQDLEIIELWLDGELPEEQVDALRRRISVEPQLAQEADRLRSDRQLRASAWFDQEPADRQVETLVANVRRQVLKDELWSSRFKTLRGISGIAASVMLLFGAGWMSHSRLSFGPIDLPQAPVVAQAPQQPTPQTELVSNQTSPVSNDRNPLSVPPDPTRLATMRPTYKVVVLDPFNRVIRAREIEKGEDAVQLADYMSRYNPTGQGTPQPPGGGIVPVNSPEK